MINKLLYKILNRDIILFFTRIGIIKWYKKVKIGNFMFPDIYLGKIKDINIFISIPEFVYPYIIYYDITYDKYHRNIRTNFDNMFFSYDKKIEEKKIRKIMKVKEILDKRKNLKEYIHKKDLKRKDIDNETKRKYKLKVLHKEIEAI